MTDFKFAMREVKRLANCIGIDNFNYRAISQIMAATGLPRDLLMRAYRQVRYGDKGRKFMK